MPTINVTTAKSASVIQTIRAAVAARPTSRVAEPISVCAGGDEIGSVAKTSSGSSCRYAHSNIERRIRLIDGTMITKHGRLTPLSPCGTGVGGEGFGVNQTQLHHN